MNKRNVLLYTPNQSFFRWLSDPFKTRNVALDCVDSNLTIISQLKQKKYDVLLVDYDCQGEYAKRMLDAAKQHFPSLKIIFLGDAVATEEVVETLYAGADYWMNKPVDVPKLLDLIFEMSKPMNPIRIISELASVSHDNPYPIIGEHESVLQLKTMIQHSAKPICRSVLVTGENGVGKELIAQNIRRLSKRKGKFVAFNCAQFSNETIASRLFGYVKGAFTGANRNTPGLLKAANKGILFLDEIGELDLDAQAKLLRVLETNTYHPVGSTTEEKTDVMIIAATNKNLAVHCKKKLFREDLYHRLNLMPIRVPALRNRISDLPLLIDHFNTQIATTYKYPKRQFTEEAMTFFFTLPWNGNIRQVRNMVNRAFLWEFECVDLAKAQHLMHLDS